ncbi:unnamed protein product [Lymnaea stagnalis]|uniref:Ribosomal RNA-processing protein 8 n=1 Tax=Lymnaea stagnalis TaxID=6523 RepID=A0AAV2H3L5_LYMST
MRRKKNKKERVTDKSNADSENHHSSPVKKLRKEAQREEKVNIEMDNNNNKQRADAKAHSIHKVKVIKMNKKIEMSSLLGKSGRKRKLSTSEDRVTLGGNKAKKFKSDKNVAKSELGTKTNGDSIVGSKVKHEKSGSQFDVNSAPEGATKPKRKRKKKNTSLKNKEKQLALKSKIKPSLAVIPKNSELNKPCDLDSAKERDQNKINETSITSNASQRQEILTKESFKKGKLVASGNQKSDRSLNGVLKKYDIESNNKAVMKKSKAEIHELHSTKQLLKKKNKEKKSKSKKERGSSNLSLSDQQTNYPKSTKLEPQKLKQSEEMSNAIKNTGVDIISKKDERKIKLSSTVPFDQSDRKNRNQNNKDVESKLKKNDQPQVSSLWGKAAVLAQQAKDKLKSARFRFINEQLYTCTGSEAMKMFRSDRTAFNVYHEGYEKQVSKWPVNPVDTIIRQIKDKPRNLVVADFGCGDAKIALSIPQKVHSFDLVATNSRVTACDMSKTPLPNESVDISVFCLSLMGTNISDYIHEANRVLKIGGLLKIAEVVSRFSGLSEFIGGVSKHGFLLLNKRDLNQMFYMIDFKKVKSVKKTSAGTIKLKPCVYKRR